MKRLTASLFTVLVLLALAAAFAIPALAATTTTNALSYEFDNGTNWTLHKNAAALNTTFSTTGYADAGIVVDLGQAKDFTGLSYDGTGSLAANIWVGDGSEAYTPGTHLLSDPVDFSYGPWGKTFWAGPEIGKSVDVSTIQGLDSEEVYAWVGLVYSGTTVNGSVSSVNGQSIGNRTISFTNNGDDTVTAVVH